MVLISMLPIGLMRAWASLEYGTWYARSAEFLRSPGMNQLRWLRMIGGRAERRLANRVSTFFTRRQAG